MANRERGEMEVVARDGTSYTFALGLNAQCAIEERLSTDEVRVTYPDFLKGLDGAQKVRLLFWAASRRHHPDLTEKDVGDVIDDAFVGTSEVMAAVNRLIAAGAPTDEDIKAAGVGKDGRPRKAQIKPNGTGAASTSEPVRLV